MVTSGAGFSGTVSFTASGLPTGATGTFFPSTVNSSGTTTLTITPSANSPTGTFPITVTAQNGSHSYAIVVVLKVMTPSAANMLTPGPGATLTGSMVTFTWDAGIGASQYQLSLGSTPGGSNYYFANTGSNQGVTATIPNGSPVTVYATLGSLISGSWQSRSYTYTTGIPVSGGTPTITMSSDPSSVRYVLNNNQASVIGPYFLFTCNGSACTATSAGHLKSCDLFGGVSVNSIIRPSQFSSLDHAFDLNVVAVNSAAYGARTLYCTADNGGTVPALPDAFTVYDATPNIEAVIQYPPDSPNGSFWVTVFGTNFGKSFGSLAVCKPGTADPCKDHPTDITPGPGIYYFASDTQINVYMYPAQTALGPYDIQVTGAGSVPAQHFQPAPAGQSKAQSNRGRIQVQCTPTVQITNRPILITLSTSHPGTYEATLTSTASPAGGVYTWTTDNAGMVGFLTPATGSSASQVTLGITSTNDRATITLTYVSPCGASTSDSFTFALNNDTTAVAWVDAAPIRALY